MREWVKSQPGLVTISIVYMLWLILIHAISSFFGGLNVFMQCLGYLPIPVIAWCFFSDTLRPYLHFHHSRILLFLLVIYGILGINAIKEGASWIGFITLLVLVAPMEELLFRGILYKELCRYHSKVNAWIITVVLFSITHLGQRIFVDGYIGIELLGSMLQFTIVSLLLCGIFTLSLEYSGTLWMPALLHCLWNENAMITLLLFVPIFLYLYWRSGKTNM